MKKCWFLLFLLMATSVSAQTRVSGRVLDEETGEGLIGAHIYLLSNWRTGTTAGVDGKFELLIDSASSDSLVISFIGFREVVLPITETVEVRLSAIQMQGQEVVVEAKPLIAEEFKYLQINKLEIYTNPAAKADPILAVNSLPSATTTDESANISLRGSSPIETGIVLNNVPVYDAVRYSRLNGIGTFSIFNTAIIKDVVVFPGNPPLEFGNTTSGVISLSTDDLIVDTNTTSAVISLANIGFSRSQKLSKNQSLKVFSNWQPSAAIKTLNEASLSQIKSFKSGDLGLYWYGSDKNMSWKVLNYTVFEGYEFNFRHPSFEGVFDQKKKRSFVVSTVEFPLGIGVMSLNNGLSASKAEFAYSNVSFGVDQQDFFGGLNYLVSKPGYSLKTGVSYDFRGSQVDGNFHEFFYALGPNHPTTAFNESAAVKTPEGFVYFKYYLSEKITVGSGLRKNIPSENEDSYLSHQVNVAYNNKPWSVTLGTGTYHKNGLLENTGEPFVSGSDQVSADVRYEKDDYQVAFSLFNKSSRIDSGGYTAKGAELLFDAELSPRISFSSSFTWLDASDDEESNYAFDVNYFIRGNLSWTSRNLWGVECILLMREGTVYLPVSSSRFDQNLLVYEPFNSENTNRLPAYFNLSISINKIFAISEKINVIGFASVGNIFNNENISSYEYNFDYSERTPSLFSQRTGYFGAVINF